MLHVWKRFKGVLTPVDVAFFRKVLVDSSSERAVLCGASLGGSDDLTPYNHDWLGKYQGSSPVVLRPRTTEHVAEVLRYCQDRGIAVVPQGGNTGLVGGSVPSGKSQSEIVLSLGRMNQVYGVDRSTRIVKCGAGTILAHANDALHEFGLEMPLDMASAGSCTVGGNVATNAGGIYFVSRRGVQANLVGLEVVLANGNILDLNYSASLLKDAAGYSMKNLFVGSEGTLGVVTRVAMQAFPVGKDIQTALVANLRTYEERQRLFEFVLDHVPSLRAFEFFEDKVLFETSGSLSDAVLDELSATYPGTSFAQSDAQRKSFWHLREDMPLKVARVARERKLPLNKFDVSVPIQSYDALVQKVVALLSTIPNCELFVYGHYADGNLHINIIGQMEVEHLQEIYDAVVDCNGSISAEHGIGVMKKSAFHRAKPRELIQAMKAIKSALDPHHILNPGKIL